MVATAVHTQSSQKASDVKGGRKGFQHDWMKVKMRATALGIARMIKMKESRKTKVNHQGEEMARNLF